ncbi:MAG: PLDc N-terminal domain-containing protein [Desulfobacter sp.]|nr:MAG: PLDc N-terminal domain-containing protein [Desulfobacter sp.]
MDNSLATFLLFHLGTIVVGILVLSALGHMVYQRREPTSMIAWLLAIILLPYVAVPLYFIFRSRKLKRKVKSQFILACKGEVPESKADSLDLVLRNNGIAGATTGNSFNFYPDGIRAHNVLMDHIRAAEKQILISTYVFGSDVVARSIISTLARKAAQGVDVRLLIDSIGSLPLYLFQYPLKRFRKAGGKVAFYMPLLTRPFQNYINLRNHRKIFIFDDTTVMAGGMNLSKEYLGPIYKKKRWIDILFEIRGPAVFHYREIFTQDWNHSSKALLELPKRLPEPAGNTGIQVVPSGPDIPSDALYEALLSAIFGAKERIWIVTPYFVPDKSLLQALIIARHRRVDVKLITPASSNHLIADLGRSSFMRDVDAKGIEVHLYQDGMIHAKAILIDSQGMMMGSANFDQRSLFLNYEAVSFIYGEEAVSGCETWMRGLMARCKGEMATAGRWRRMGENLMRIFAPLL